MYVNGIIVGSDSRELYHLEVGNWVLLSWYNGNYDGIILVNMSDYFKTL